MSLNIRKFSHHFVVEEPDGFLQNAINEYSGIHLLQTQSFKLWNQKVVKKNHKMYGVRTFNPLLFRMHINHLSSFLSFMATKGYTHPRIIEEFMYAPAEAKFDIVTPKRPWKNQPDIINYLVSSGSKKVIELQAGQGKTLCALFAVAEIGQRAALIIKNMYIPRWLDDLTKSSGIFHLKKNEITVVKGGQSLADLIELSLAGENEYKFIVFSNKTLALYYKHYITGENMDKYHGVMPWDLMKVLRVGVRVTDEAHQDFHACFRDDLFTHIPKTISLSATLEPDDPFLKKMYEVVYPKDLRYGGASYEVYVDVVAVPFRIDRDIKSPVRFNQKGMLSYNHGVYEESILASKKRLNNWMHMITELTQKYFISKRQKDYRLIIFAERVDMCILITEHLRGIYPDLNIHKYTEEEPYTILDELDIIVSTPKSAGTAVDISKLQVCLNLVAIGSTQSNLQMIGRLRELHGVDVKPTLVYVYCTDIEKHLEYHYKKRDFTFRGKVLSYTDLHPPIYAV